MKSILLGTTALVAWAGVAVAADLGMPRSPVAMAVVAPTFNWTGFYIGAHAGYGFSRTTWTDVFTTNLSGNGPLIGGQLGFNYQINRLVIGAEADLAFAAISGRNVNAFGIPGFNVADRTTMLGSLRLRGGFAADKALFYVTGGLGIARNNHLAFLGLAGSSSNATQTGWTLGGGIEYALTPNWTAKVEYLYYNFGTRALDNGLTGTVRTDIHTVKLGVNYLFSTGPSAIVARY